MKMSATSSSLPIYSTSGQDLHESAIARCMSVVWEIYIACIIVGLPSVRSHMIK